MRAQTRYSSKAFCACNRFWLRPFATARLTFASLTLASAQTGCMGTVNASADQVLQQGLLRVQPVFGFVPHDALGPIDNFRRNFLAAMRWQAVHEQRAGFRLPHHRRVDHPVREIALPVLVFGLETHAGPDVGGDEVRVAARLARIRERFETTATVHPGALRLEFVAGRCRYVELEAEDCRCLQPGVADVVGIADP